MSKSESKRISHLLKEIATLMERDPNFLSELNQWVDNYEVSGVKRGANDHKPPLSMDVFETFSRIGKKGLESTLNELEIPELRRIIMSNNLDPSKLSHKWKDKEKMVKLVVDRVSARASKGSAFMNYGQDLP